MSLWSLALSRQVSGTRDPKAPGTVVKWRVCGSESSSMFGRKPTSLKAAAATNPGSEVEIQDFVSLESASLQVLRA